ncbi:MAG TPA: hypothetical protein VE995_07790 [Gaiellaceae bacterium]|nr:hypothetical protein [Gaiellaceae bacterium]
MRSRRFLLLAGVLVALNLVLWLAPQGLALRRSIIQQLFGPKLVRAEVLLRDGSDWRIDRGVIVSVSPSQLTVREADGRVQPISLAASTRIVGFGRVFSPSALGRGWRVLVTWPANGPAELVQVEARGGHGAGGHGARHTARALPPLS